MTKLVYRVILLFLLLMTAAWVYFLIKTCLIFIGPTLAFMWRVFWN